jgi:hypothetical protein
LAFEVGGGGQLPLPVFQILFFLFKSTHTFWFDRFDDIYYYICICLYVEHPPKGFQAFFLRHHHDESLATARHSPTATAKGAVLVLSQAKPKNISSEICVVYSKLKKRALLSYHTPVGGGKHRAPCCVHATKKQSRPLTNAIKRKEVG